MRTAAAHRPPQNVKWTGRTGNETTTATRQHGGRSTAGTQPQRAPSPGTGQWTREGPRTAPGNTAEGPQEPAADRTASPRIDPKWHTPRHGRNVGAHRVGMRSALRRTPREHRVGSACTHRLPPSRQPVPETRTGSAQQDRYTGYDSPAFARQGVRGRPPESSHAEQHSGRAHPAGLLVIVENAAGDRDGTLVDAGTNPPDLKGRPSDLEERQSDLNETLTFVRRRSREMQSEEQRKESQGQGSDHGK